MPRVFASLRCALRTAILAFCAILVAGCADEALPPGVVRLQVWGLKLGDETPGLIARIKEFERRNPNIKVSVLAMGAGDMNPQKLMTAIVGKVPPDLIHQDRFTIGDWASRGTFRPLDDLIARDMNLPEGIRPEQFYSACWSEARYQGRVFAIPYGTDDRALYYNRAIFRDAGLDPDKPPRTWEELKDYTSKLTKYASDGSYRRIGFIPNFGNSWLYIYSWQNGGEFMSGDGRRCTMDNPESVAALQYMIDLYDLLGGVTKVTAYQSGFQANEADPFLTGKVAMKTDGNWVLNNIARFAPDLDFAVVPAPVPAERLEQTLGGKPGRFHGQDPYVTWAGGYSFAIPQGAAHPEEAWRLIKWMCSPEAALVEARVQKAYNTSKGRPYVPNLSANRAVNDAVLAQYAPASPKFRKALQQFVDLLPAAKFRPVTFVGQRLWDEHARAFELATNYRTSGKSAKAAMTEGTRVVQAELDKAFRQDSLPLLDQRVPAGICAALAIGLIGFLATRVRKVMRMGDLSRREAVAGYLFAAPWIFGFAALTAGPLLTSIFLSFCSYDVLHPPRYVGALNYCQLFGEDSYYLWKSLGNVAFFAAIGIPLGICTGLSIALLLNAKAGGMAAYRTCFYIPSIVPVVASAVLWMWILNGDADRGLVNAGWKATITAWTGIGPPGWLSAAEWAKPALILQGLWGAGSGMILWLAGLQGIPLSLYEAAELDGAGSWARFRNVTLPMLSPYIFFQLIMGTIGAVQEFDRVYILSSQGTGATSAGPVDSLLVPVLYLFNNAFRYFKMGYASALAWVLFVVILALTLAQLKLAPRWVHYESEKK